MSKHEELTKWLRDNLAEMAKEIRPLRQENDMLLRRRDSNKKTIDELVEALKSAEILIGELPAGVLGAVEVHLKMRSALKFAREAKS